MDDITLLFGRKFVIIDHTTLRKENRQADMN